jgi:protein-disulfide isomerase
MDRRFLTILGAVIIIFIGIFAVSQNSSNKSNSGSSSNSQAGSNNVEGQGSSGVTLVEYGDYECPICGEYYQPLKQAVADNSSQIYFQFKNLPLTSIHPNAFAGARAAQAAGMQGKYWEMHDKLYDNQNDWASSSNPQTIFAQYAKDIGLNVTQFNTDYASSKVNTTINADLAAFGKTGLPQATPTFFLNGTFLDNSKLVDPQSGTPSAAKISSVLKAEIAKKASAAKPAASQSAASSGNPY